MVYPKTFLQQDDVLTLILDLENSDSKKLKVLRENQEYLSVKK